MDWDYRHWHYSCDSFQWQYDEDSKTALILILQMKNCIVSIIDLFRLDGFIFSSFELNYSIWDKFVFVCQYAYISMQIHLGPSLLSQNVWCDPTKAVSVAWHAKILPFGVCPSCCLLPRLWIFHRPIFYPCLSGIWCACCCLGMAHEFSPKCSVLGFIANKLCATSRLLIEAGCQTFFFFFCPWARQKQAGFHFLYEYAIALFACCKISLLNTT